MFNKTTKTLVSDEISELKEKYYSCVQFHYIFKLLQISLADSQGQQNHKHLGSVIFYINTSEKKKTNDYKRFIIQTNAVLLHLLFIKESS